MPAAYALDRRAPEMAWQRAIGGVVRGFCLGRHGTTYAQVGPIVAEGHEGAVALCRAAMGRLAGRALVLDVPAAQGAFSA